MSCIHLQTLGPLLKLCLHVCFGGPIVHSSLRGEKIINGTFMLRQILKVLFVPRLSIVSNLKKCFHIID